MRFISGIILMLALNVQTQASQYEGRITSVEDGLVRLNETNLKQTFDLTFKDSDTALSISKLKPNDFVSFEGGKNLTKSFLRVDSINYVGLASLMGIWTGDDGYCYKFSSYTEFLIFPKSGDCNRKSARATNPREFAYTLNVADEAWFMLLSDAKSRYAADVTFTDPKSIEMSLYDVNNGKILRLIKLTK
ncbi:MAG: hypothetical protein H7256_04720 [Bdellovibrio sp.]|nr:hypothetical protein [Bdellovibrio sp.]